MEDLGCVTVLMSTYNGEKYLKEQLDSILQQDYPNVQVLIRDDCSSDATLSILKDYKEKSNISYYSGNNYGCAKSFWDLVCNATKSDYYAFADQDDVWDTDKISRAVIQLNKEDNKIPLLYCARVRIVDESLNVIQDDSSDGQIIETFKHSLVRSLAPGCTFVFNEVAREKLKEYSCNDNFFDIHDWVAHRIIAALGKVIKDKKTTMNYRQHSNNLIGANRNSISQYLKRYANLRNSGGKRFKFVRDLDSVFSQEMSKENKQLLDIFLNYKTDKKSKLLFYNSYKSEFGSIEKIFFKKIIKKERI